MVPRAQTSAHIGGKYPRKGFDMDSESKILKILHFPAFLSLLLMPLMFRFDFFSPECQAIKHKLNFMFSFLNIWSMSEFISLTYSFSPFNHSSSSVLATSVFLFSALTLWFFFFFFYKTLTRSSICSQKRTKCIILLDSQRVQDRRTFREAAASQVPLCPGSQLGRSLINRSQWLKLTSLGV